MIVELGKSLQENDAKVVLDIVFWKTAINERRKAKGKELIDTYCQVSRIMYTDKPMILITKTIAFQNPLDIFNKIIGRKVALTKAIADIEFLQPIPECPGINRHRHQMRRHIWGVFHQTFGRWN